MSEGYRALGRLIPLTSKFCVSNPGATRCSITALRTSKPAPTSSTIASEICETTSVARSRLRIVARSLRAPSRSVCCRSSREARSAGNKPKPTPHASASTVANASTGTLSVASSRRGTPKGLLCTKKRTPTAATPNPTAAPAIARMRLSVSSCATMRGRPAPNAFRTAISFRRTAPRARSRFAMFTQAMRSTRPTAPSRMSSSGRTGPTIHSRSGVAMMPPSKYE